MGDNECPSVGCDCADAAPLARLLEAREGGQNKSAQYPQTENL